YQLAASHNIPFHHLPVTPENKYDQEAKLLEIMQEKKIDLVVLARYMQVLSDELCRKLSGRAINIHHSFLPSFKGAKPYYQAHESAAEPSRRRPIAPAAPPAPRCSPRRNTG